MVDVIDFSDAFNFTDPSDNGEPITDAEKEDQLDDWLTYNADGTLTDANNTNNVWFEVYTNYEGTAAAETVYVEVDGDVFMWDADKVGGAGWDLQQDWDLV